MCKLAKEDFGQGRNLVAKEKCNLRFSWRIVSAGGMSSVDGAVEDIVHFLLLCGECW